MADLIENLRRRPEAYRKRVTLFLSVFITLLIFIAWLVVLFNTFGNSQVAGGEEVGERIGPFESLLENFNSGLREIGRQTGKLRRISPF